MKNAMIPMEAALPLGSLDSYISWTYQTPMLSAEEEKALAEKWHADGDIEAARRLVASHLRFVVSISRGYLGYGLSQADLIQEGAIGLMKAVKRFDPTMGVRLVSFAVHWIKAEMHEFILRNWRIVKVATTKAQRKLFFNLRKASKQLMWFTNEEIADVAKELDVPIEEVRQMEMRLIAGRDESFDPIGESSNDDDAVGKQLAPAQYLTDSKNDPAMMAEAGDWTHNREEMLAEALSQLDARSQSILRARWLSDKKTTLQALSKEYGVSLERIRQIEKLAMEKLRGLLGDKG